MISTPEPCKNEWTYEMAKSIDNYWETNPLEFSIHLIESLGCLQSMRDGDSVLEVGCGTGHIYKLLSPSTIGSYTGLDSSQGMLDVFKEKYPQVRLVHGDATSLPFGDGEFDVAICVEVLRHMTQQELAIQELYRVAKRTAIFTIEMAQGPSRYAGEHRQGSYLSSSDPSPVHYQIYNNSSEFLAWIEQTFNCGIAIKVLSATKWMFVMDKTMPGLAWDVIPLSGLENLTTLLMSAVADLRHLSRVEALKDLELRLNVRVKSVVPLELEFGYKIDKGVKDGM